MTDTLSWILKLQISSMDRRTRETISSYLPVGFWDQTTRIPGKADELTINGEVSTSKSGYLGTLQELITLLLTLQNLSLGGSLDAEPHYAPLFPTVPKSGSTSLPGTETLPADSDLRRRVNDTRSLENNPLFLASLAGESALAKSLQERCLTTAAQTLNELSKSSYGKEKYYDRQINSMLRIAEMSLPQP